MNPVAF